MMYQETRTPSTHDQRYASQPNQLCTLLLHSGLADSQGLVWFGDTRVELVSIHLYTKAEVVHLTLGLLGLGVLFNCHAYEMYCETYD